MKTAADIKKAIIEKHVQHPEPVEPAELLGEKAYLFRVTSKQLEAWRRLANDKNPDVADLASAKLVQVSFRAEDGTCVFGDLDVPILAGMPGGEIDLIYNRCLAINGFGKEGAAAILKNCATILGIDGVYASLANMGCPCPSCTRRTAATSSANNGLPSATGPSATPPKTGGPGSSA